MDDPGRRPRLVGEVAGDAARGVGDLERRALVRQISLPPVRRQRGANRQPGGIASARGSVPGDRRQSGGARVAELRHGSDQRLRVRVARSLEDVVDRAELDRCAGVHDEHVLGEARDDPEVVRYQHDCHVTLLGETVEQVDHTGLRRHVERCRGLVGDQQLRVRRERHGDHDALPHTAGELVRVLVEPGPRRLHPDFCEEIDRALDRFGLARVRVEADGLDQLVADRLDRIEGAESVLEDHRDPALRARCAACPRLHRSARARRA